MRLPFLVVAAALLLETAPVRGEGIASFELEGNEARASIELGGIALADLTLSFEDAIGLSQESLGLDARIATASELLNRLPANVSLPAALPLVLKIAPPASGPLAFTGTASIELHTHLLGFTPSSPLRLFRAQNGGAFVDVTQTMGTGSYRVRGDTGGFSEFAILVDLRGINAVITSKYNRLQALLDADAATLPAPLVASLQGDLDASRAAYQGGQLVAAVSELEQLDSTVRQQSGSAIPNVWRSSRDLTNMAGELRAAAGTLRFSLNLKANSSGSF